LNKILLLGGAGFIGTRLSQTLIERGYEVTVLDCFSEQVHGKDYKTSFLYNQINANVNLVYGDIHNAELLLY
jgi:dTDP-L-rhamnose 4-epimerase